MRQRHVILPPVLPPVERTPDGDQFLLEGFVPVSDKERLQHLAAQPLRASCPQNEADFGLFDLCAHNQGTPPQ